MTMNSDAMVLVGQDLAKDFVQGDAKIHVLRAASISVRAGERIAIVGASGSGKTTLLQLLGGLDLPTSGTVEIAGSAMNRLNDAERGYLRNRAVGFVYQFHHLLPEFTALENVAMPLLVRRMNPRAAAQRAGALLTRVGLAERLTHRPSQLSGGERQRAAVARALVTQPRLVLADEPTGNLDSQTGTEIMNFIREFNESLGMTIIMVTHERTLAERYASRMIFLADGKLVGDQSNVVSSASGQIRGGGL